MLVSLWNPLKFVLADWFVPPVPPIPTYVDQAGGQRFLESVVAALRPLHSSKPNSLNHAIGRIQQGVSNYCRQLRHGAAIENGR
jgi:hypothetical protein